MRENRDRRLRGAPGWIDCTRERSLGMARCLGASRGCRSGLFAEDTWLSDDDEIADKPGR